jgi:hypothetical protein
MNCKIIIKISYLFKQRHSDNMYIFYNTNRDHIIKQLFNCMYTKHVTRVLFLNAEPELYCTLYIIFTLKSSDLEHIWFKHSKQNPRKMHLLSLLFIILHMHRFFLNIRWLITYPYNILFRWRNMILALHRKWSHQYAYRWRTMILAIRSWFQVDYCLPYYVSILGCALSDLLSAILLD